MPTILYQKVFLKRYYKSNYTADPWTTWAWTAQVHLYMDYTILFLIHGWEDFGICRESWNQSPADSQEQLKFLRSQKLYLDFYCSGVDSLSPAHVAQELAAQSWAKRLLQLSCVTSGVDLEYVTSVVQMDKHNCDLCY